MLKRMKVCFIAFFHLLRVLWQLLYGTWRVSKLSHPIVSVFGGARFMVNDNYFNRAHELGKRLAEINISVLTGGGPGIMKAASCGITEAEPRSEKVRIMGIGVIGLEEQPNSCVQEFFGLDYFFARKWLLTRFSSVFVVFPGGFGTLDELAEVVTQIQTKKLERVPIILYGVDYWKPFVQWLKDRALKLGTINEKDLTLFTMTDDIDELFSLIRDKCKVCTAEIKR